jgi:hypothetical protein
MNAYCVVIGEETARDNQPLAQVLELGEVASYVLVIFALLVVYGHLQVEANPTGPILEQEDHVIPDVFCGCALLDMIEDGVGDGGRNVVLDKRIVYPPAICGCHGWGCVVGFSPGV